MILNPDIENPDIENPDIENPDIENPDIENAEVYNPDIENPDIENPDIENPDIENPDIENPDIENPDIENPDIENVRVSNPDIENPDIENPDIENPDIENPDIENPDIENPDIENGAIADVTWTVTNTGNTTAAFNVNLFLAQQQLPSGLAAQLILLKTYRTPVTVPNGCQLAFQMRNVLITNIANPILVPPNGEPSNPNDPGSKNATLWLSPGEEGRIVLRVFDDDDSDNVLVAKIEPDGNPILDKNGNPKMVSIDAAVLPSEDVTPVVQQQSVDTEDAEIGITEPPLVPAFPSPQATDDSVSTTYQTPVSLNVLANDSSAFGSIKIHTVHPAGLGQNMGGGAGQIVYLPGTGLLYAGNGRGAGVIDPVTDRVVGRIPGPANWVGAGYALANTRTNLVYFRSGGNAATNSSLHALDARPGSLTYHQFLPLPALAGSVQTLTRRRGPSAGLRIPRRPGPGQHTDVCHGDRHQSGERDLPPGAAWISRDDARGDSHHRVRRQHHHRPPLDSHQWQRSRNRHLFPRWRRRGSDGRQGFRIRRRLQHCSQQRAEPRVHRDVRAVHCRRTRSSRMNSAST